MEYVAQDKRIRYERSPVNRGAAWNQNHVAFLARGKYFKLASYDDVCAPEFIERCLQILETDSSFVLSYPKSHLIDETGEIVDSNGYGNLRFRNSKFSQAARWLLQAIVGDSEIHLDSLKPRVRFSTTI